MVGDGAAPLSFGAEQVLAALDRIVEGQAVTPARWLLALREAERSLTEEVSDGRDVLALEAATSSAPAAGELLARADIAQLAGERAAAEGRPVASKDDIAAAILGSQVPPLAGGAAPQQAELAESLAPPEAELIAAGGGEPPVPAAAEPGSEDVPLSFGAEQLIAALVPAEDTRSPAALLVALVDDHAEALERAAANGIVTEDRVTRCREAVDHGADWGSLTREQLTAKASARAHHEGHGVVTPADVIRAAVDEVDKHVHDEPPTPDEEPAPEATQLSLTLESPVEPVAEAEQAAEPTGPEPTSVVPHRTEQGETAAAVEAARPATGRARTFRVFVSSTFDDFALERDVLREHVWPRLQRFCEQRGARFQAVDLRWGVSSEAAADQQTMNICLGEIERCHRVTPRPNFLVLVGDHYGWRPLPPQVPATEYDQLVERLSPEDKTLADEWYSADHNARPAQRRLRPRPEGWSDDEWAQVERRLRPALEAAARWGDLGEARRRVYQASATEQEILRGALEAGDPDQVVCVLRHIDTAAADASERDRITRFVDVDPAPVDTLRAELRARMGERIVRPSADTMEFVVPWGDPDAGLDYLTRFAEGVATMLEASIDDELREPRRRTGRLERPKRPLPADDLLDDEGWAHHDFAEERTAVFAGRGQELAVIDAYLDGDGTRPLAVTGGGGTGKSALVGEAVRHALERRPGDLVVYRFIGATPGSADGRTLLESICRELARRRGEPEQSVPTDFRELVVDFRARLELPDRRVIVFIDSLDQLSPSEGARGLAWVPGRLPAGARLVVSTRAGDTLDPLRDRTELLEVPGLAEEDGREALAAWLGDAGRTLQRDQETEVLDAFGRAQRNPLYLRLAFEEARRWWSDRGHSPLASATGAPEDASVVAPIIRDNLLARLEAEHGRVLVEHALGYLACTRFGLAESELLDLLAADPDVYRWFLLGSYHLPVDVVSAATDLVELDSDGSVTADTPAIDRARQWLTDAVAAARSGTDARPLDEFLDAVLGGPGGPSLPVVLWSRLFFDLEPYLKESEADGVTVLDFYHRELREVTGDRYADGERGRLLHERLARFFRRRADPGGQGTWEADGGRVDPRALAELPYHLTGAQDWDGVYETLTDFSFLERKAAHVGVLRRHDADGESTLYTGVFRLQDDFDRALHHMRGEGDRPERPRLIVTAVDLGDGLVVRCPHCNTVHPFDEAWQGTEIACPNPDCGGPLKVNPFVVERPGSGRVAMGTENGSAAVRTAAESLPEPGRVSGGSPAAEDRLIESQPRRSIDAGSIDFDVFVSYKREDSMFVRRVADGLIASGARVWFNEYEIALADQARFQEQIDAAIPQSARGLVFTNDRYDHSPHCRAELEQLLESVGVQQLLEVPLGAGDATHRHFPALTSARRMESSDPDEVLRYACRWLDIEMLERPRPHRSSYRDPVGKHPGTRGQPTTYVGDFGGRPFHLAIGGWTTEDAGSLLQFKYAVPNPVVHVNVAIGWDIDPACRGLPDVLAEPHERAAHTYILNHYAPHYLDLANARARGVHLLWHEGGANMGLTYLAEPPGGPSFWTRKVSVVMANPALERTAEFVFTFGVLGGHEHWRDYCLMAPLMDAMVTSLRWT